ncbi:MAG: hypothetical protein JOZ05_15255 [Acetobacteraceae bacterium]|nr:hypothetical protein [Acetobacteraceae bacterium]
MAERQARETLVREINEAFSAARIADTLRRVSPLRPSADFIDICHSLGLLEPIITTTLRDYKRELTMPPLSRRIMTLAFRTSLLAKPNPIPLELKIVNGRAEAVEVTTTEALIAILLTRTRPVFRRPE